MRLMKLLFKDRSLGYKFLVLSGIPVIVVVIFISANILTSQKEVLIEISKKRASLLTKLSILTVSNEFIIYNKNLLDSIVDNLSSDTSVVYAIIVDSSDNRILAHSDHDWDGKIIDNGLTSSFEMSGIYELSGNINILGNKYGVLKIGFSLKDVHHEIAKMKQKFLYVAFIAVVLGAVFSIILARIISIPIKALVKQTKIIGAGNFGNKVVYKSKDIIGQLANEFNKMVSDLIAKQQQVIDSEARLRRLVDNMPVMMNALDKDYNIIAWNRECERVTGYSAKEMIENPHSLEMLYPDDGYREKMISEIVDFGYDVRNKEYTLNRKDGTEKTISWSNLSGRISIPGWNTWAIGVDVTKRVQAEKTLRESEKKYRTTLMSTPDTVAISRVEDGLFLELNDGFTRMFGYSREEALDRTVTDLGLYLLPIDRDRLTDTLLTKEEVNELEFTYRRKDGTLFDGIQSARPIRYGNEDCLISVVKDISSFKEAQRALKKSEDRLRQVAQNMPVMMAAVDEDYNIVIWNRECELVTGYKASEIIDNPNALEMLYPDADYRDEVIKSFDKNSDYRAREHTITRKDGTQKTINWSNISATYPIPGWHTWSIGVDVTVRKQAEELLRESEANLAKAQQIAHIGNWNWDIVTNKVSWSQELYLIVGLSPEEFDANFETYLKCIHPDDLEFFKNLTGKMLKEKKSYSAEYRIIRSNNDTRNLHEQGEVTLDTNGKPINLFATVQDITERKRAEEEKMKLEAQLRHSQKMEAVGTLVGGISHDFNNLIQVISSFTEMLLKKKDRSDPDYDLLKEIDQTAQQAGKLTERLLILSRRVESKLRPTTLNREVEKVSKLLKRTIPQMISLEFRPAKDLKIINADPVQIQQILMSLGINARDALPEGGKLLFKTENVTLNEQYCKTHPGAVPSEYVLLSVSDTGCGMDKNILEHIFEPFYTTKEIGEGTGLGLAMVYGIVKSHGGYITCDSEPGQGTTFKIYFPAIMTESPLLPRTERKKEDPAGGRETILVVDDKSSILRANEIILEGYGYTMISAESGERAIEIFEREKENIDLVILDVGMPGMGGFKCIEQLLELDPKTKIIIASGYASKGKIKEVLESGAAKYISKPYRQTEFLKTIREALDEN